MNRLTDTEKKLLSMADDSAGELVSLTQELVRIPTRNIPPSGEEKDGQVFIRKWLGDNGISNELIDLNTIEELPKHSLFFKGEGNEARNYSGRPNLVAWLDSNSSANTLILSGHIDTMPEGTSSWEHGPFSGTVHNGRIYGRGSFDMKGGLAAALTAMKIIKSSGVKLNGNLLFESVVDEEHAGANGTLADRVLGYNGSGVIIPEPSSLNVYNAHKGFRIAHIILKGKSGMSFAGEEVLNPVESVGVLIEGFKIFRKKRKESCPEIVEYKNDEDPVPVFMNKLQAGEFSLAIPMQVPEECGLEVYWLTMPGETKQDIENEFSGHLNSIIKKNEDLQKFEISTRFSHRWLPGTRTDPEEKIVKVAQECAGIVLDTQVAPSGAPYPCDLFIFDYFNIPGVIVGPCGANCHGSNEFVEIDSLVKLLKILLLTIVRFCN